MVALSTQLAVNAIFSDKRGKNNPRVDPMTKTSKYVELGTIHHKAKDSVA